MGGDFTQGKQQDCSTGIYALAGKMYIFYEKDFFLLILPNFWFYVF